MSGSFLGNPSSPNPEFRVQTPGVEDHPKWFQWFQRMHTEDLERYGAPFQLHHYVRAFNPLMSILAQRELWATDVSCLKDTTEFRHGVPMCVEALDLIRERSLAPHVELAKTGLRELFGQRVFVTCLSTSKSLQSQWDDYAGQQRGFVISFDMLVLSALDAPQGIRVMPVEYGRDAQQARTQRAVIRAVEDLESCTPGLSQVEMIWSVRSRFTLLMAELFFLCATFKNDNYAPEHEWRIIYSRALYESNALPISTRISNGHAVDHVCINLNSRSANHELPTFASVTAGPRTPRRLSVLARDFLREYTPATEWNVQTAF